jgi:hypothetical protein
MDYSPQINAQTSTSQKQQDKGRSHHHPNSKPRKDVKDHHQSQEVSNQGCLPDLRSRAL